VEEIPLEPDNDEAPTTKTDEKIRREPDFYEADDTYGPFVPVGYHLLLATGGHDAPGTDHGESAQ
jgi:hypothetical protein